MKRLTILGSVVGAMALAAGGCGDNSAKCGDGTFEEDGICLPDGTVTCGQGTVMDATGNCVPSDEVCAEGTVFLEGLCVPEDDTLTAELEAEAEPNDGFEETDGVAGAFSLDAVGDGTSMHGCITPYRDLDANGNMDVDYDMWLVTVEEPSLVDITADGVHGLSAGFILIPASQTTQPLIDADWTRFGINLATDTSSRQVFLPIPGTYALVMSDSRSIFLDDGGAGSNEETCYFTSIEKVAIPTPTALAADTVVNSTVGGDSVFYSYNPTEGDLVDVEHDIPSEAAAPSVVAMNNDAFFRYGEPASILGGLHDADDVTLVVEPVYNYAQAPVAFSLRAHPLATGALPIDGTTASGRSNVSAASTWDTLDDVTWMWFDVGDNEVVHFDMTFASSSAPYDLNLAIVDADTGVISTSLFYDFYFGTNYTDAFEGWARFPEAGRYYVAFFPPQLDEGATFDVTSTVTRVVPGAAALGTPINDAAFNDLGRAWHDLDGGTSIWMGADASATGFTGDVRVRFYDPAEVGVFDLDVASTTTAALANDGGDDGWYGYITYGEGNDFLVSIQDTGAGADNTATYDLSVADRVFTNLGMLVTGTPLARTAEDALPYFTAPGGTLYFVRATPGALLTITASPAADDIAIDVIDRTEYPIRSADTGLEGDPEEVYLLVPSDGWVAFRVYGFDSDANHAFDLDVVASDPCEGGTRLTLDATDDFEANDEGVTSTLTLPFSFSLYNEPVTNYWVSSNGFLSFGPNVDNAFYSNRPFPTAAAPNGVVAPYWDDLTGVAVCQFTEATQVTIAWRYGNDFYEDVDFSVVLHDNGDIDFVYGTDQVADASYASVGAESLDGSEGLQFGYNTTGAAIDRTFNTNG